MKNRQQILNFVLGFILWCFSLLIIIPLLMIVLNSVKNVPESAVMSLKLPTEFHFEKVSSLVPGTSYALL